MKWYLAMLFDGRTVGFGVAYSIPFALSCFLGAFVYDNAESGFAIILATAAFLIALILYFGAVKLLDRLDERVSVNNRGTVVPAQKKRSAVATFAAIWVIWLFWYALYYPGCTSTDSMDVLKMTLGFPFEEDHFRYDTLNSHHPLLYVGFVALFGRIGVLLGGIGGAIAVTSFVQMTIFAACAAYVVWWVRDRTRSRVAWIAAFLFFAINPLIGRYAVTLWKDVLFSAALTIFCLECFDLFESRGGLLKKTVVLYRICDVVSFCFPVEKQWVYRCGSFRCCFGDRLSRHQKTSGCMGLRSLARGVSGSKCRGGGFGGCSCSLC